MNRTQILIILVLLAAVAGVSYYFLAMQDEPQVVEQNNDQDQMDNGNNEGSNEDADADEGASYNDLIRVTEPLPGDEISSPLVIKGEARGNWFFEATFPVVLTDQDGLIVAEGYVEAQDEWMTTEYVPFEGTLTFTTPDFGENGSLILQKANASGLPEHDDAFEFQVLFEQ